MRERIKNTPIVLLILFSIHTHAQERVDTLKDYSLLQNPYIQIEATEAINSMYNFEFEKSKRHFFHLKKKYPWHPLPYLLLGLNYWWRMIPDFHIETWDTTFLLYMDSTVVLAKNLRNEHNEIEGAFLLVAAYAFKGRFYSERGHYRKAVFAGKNALKYFNECKDQEEYSPELLFGNALFNYYGEWIRENYPLLRPLMTFFPKGDKELGIAQLKEVAGNSFYSRTEAQYYLMRLLDAEGKNPREAIQVASYLNKTYPNNAYFERYYARLLYQNGRNREAEKECKEIIVKIDSAYEGYRANSGRYAAFFLGHISEQREDFKEAKKYYRLSMSYAEKARATNRGYYFYSILHLGDIAVKEKEPEAAKEYYRRVRKISKRKHPANKIARKHLRKLPPT